MKSTGLLSEIEETRLAMGEAAFWWLGQLSYVVKVGDAVLYLDPYLSPSSRRNVPPLLDAAQISHADWVFGSHDHGDHIDPGAIQGIAAASPHARFVVSKIARARLLDLGVAAGRIVGLDGTEAFREGPLTITPVPAYQRPRCCTTDVRVHRQYDLPGGRRPRRGLESSPDRPGAL